MSQTEQIVEFLLEANQVGYGSDKANVETAPDGTHRIIYQAGDNRFEDVWWGGNPFAGQESVALGGQVVWSMQYRGWMEPGFEDQTGPTFQFLKHALLRCTAEEPLRGPSEFQEGDFKYAMTWGANLENFHGQEKIWKADQHIYTCHFLGGEVDL